MRGRKPKPPELRQRRNKVTTAAALGGPSRRAPKLPKEIEWHPMTKVWWRHIWRSPMASQWLESDVDGLLVLADMHNRYWSTHSTKLATEVRQREAQFGLTPLDRRRLQWEVDETEARHTLDIPDETGDVSSLIRLVK